MTDRPAAPRPPWEGRRVVLGVTGGLAAYKAVQLARDLTLAGCRVDVVMTEAATEFVGATTFEGVTGRRAHTEFLAGEGAALHLELGARADLVLVAPATADFIARAAHGRSDDLLACTLLATRAPVLLAPAMNRRMWDHPQTRRNVDHCRDLLGYEIVGPASGPLGAGEGEGVGRMVEPDLLLDEAGRRLGRGSLLEDRTVVVTAGPTWEPVDPVRFLGNRSSGRMGFAIAREARLRGARVTLVTGPVGLPDPVGVEVVRVETAREMLQAVEAVVDRSDVAIFAAAVADMRPGRQAEGKLKRETWRKDPRIELVENPDIARATRDRGPAGVVRVGFALETGHLLEGARTKLEEKGFDLVVANDPGEEGAGFGSVTNRVTLVGREGGEEALPLLAKEEVASRILDRVEQRLSDGSGSGALRSGEEGTP